MDQSTVFDSPTSLKIIYRPLAELRAFSKNARTHSKHQIRQIAESVKEFGFTNPILIDSKDTIIAGHGRVMAAKLLGSVEVPTIRLEGLTPDQIRAYVIADNKLAENAGWDKSVLAIELQHLLSIDESFDVTVIRSKARISPTGRAYGGAILSRGTLYHLLNNPIYMGKVPHKGALYPGAHEAIVGEQIWQRAQLFSKRIRSTVSDPRIPHQSDCFWVSFSIRTAIDLRRLMLQKVGDATATTSPECIAILPLASSAYQHRR
ncbi:MAG TPA: ParB N-terminal domain-containing protein [Edaphobacter sp.]|nr:ParB N-terminal domain-containing protein [Edaphobacter sp.]